MKSKFRKLVRMSPGEIRFRLKHSLALWWERTGYRSGRFNWNNRDWRKRLCGLVDHKPAASQLAEWWSNHMRDRSESAMFLSENDLAQSCDLYGKLFADRQEGLLARAEDVCRGAFSLLGIDVVLHDPIDWHRDPKSGHLWNKEFHGDIDFAFCREGGDDVKYVWELSRHEFLIDCAKAYRLTGESRYVERITQIVSEWTEANPYLNGVHWASALEVAVRSLSWLWSYQFCQLNQLREADAHLAWIKSFYQHGTYLHRHLSYYFSPNNHLIGEAATLYLLGCFFPEFDESDAWRAHGWQAIVQHYAEQYYEDGGSSEQATFYHNYCLGFLLLVVFERQRRGESVPEEMLGCIERALEFTMWMTRSDGTVPRIGDTDNARSVAFENLPLWDFRNLLCLGAILFKRGDMKQLAGRFSEDALWLLGREGYETFVGLKSSCPPQQSRAFLESGYYVMRSGWGKAEQHLVFDCGPLAAGLHTDGTPSSAHGHSDLLSFSLAANGKPLLVDGGFYTYDEDPSWYRYFREAAAHNTIRLDGASHARLHISNAWSYVAIPEAMRWHSTPLFEYVESGHSGFFGVSPPVRHRRAIFWNLAETWLVLDRLEGEGVHAVEVFFHFAPADATLRPDCKGVVVRTADNTQAELELLGEVACNLELIEGGAGPDGGWIGTGYGFRQRAPIARFFGQLQLPCSLSFAIRCWPTALAEQTTKDERARM